MISIKINQCLLFCKKMCYVLILLSMSLQLLHRAMSQHNIDDYFTYNRYLLNEDDDQGREPFHYHDSFDLNDQGDRQGSISDLELMSQEVKPLRPTELVEDSEQNIPNLIQSALEPPQQHIIPFVLPENTLEKRNQIIKGFKEDTVQLNTNFKTLISQFFKEKIQLKEVTEWEKQHILQFDKRGPSYKSLKLLCRRCPQNQGILKACEQFFNSTECIRRILGNHCGMRNKLLMIKMIDKMRRNILDSTQIHRWKRNPKTIK